MLAVVGSFVLLELWPFVFDTSLLCVVLVFSLTGPLVCASCD